MVRTRQTASLQLSRTPWTLRRKRKIWRAKPIKAARSSTGCSEPWSKKLRQPCDDGYCWKEQHINWGILECRLRTLPWTPTTVRWRRSLALSEKLFRLLPASTGACVIRTFICRRPTKFTFLPLVRQQKEEKTWIYSIVLQATTPGTRGVYWNTGTLTEEQLDRPLPTVVQLLPWRESNKTLRQLLENIVFTKEVWTAALSGADMDMNGPPKSQRSPQALLQRLEKTDAELHRILGDIRNPSGWGATFVGALCGTAAIGSA